MAQDFRGDEQAPGSAGSGNTVTAYQLRTCADAYIGKRVTFTVPDRWNRPGKDKVYDGSLTRAEPVRAVGYPVCTAVNISTVRGAIYMDDNASITVLAD